MNDFWKLPISNPPKYWGQGILAITISGTPFSWFTIRTVRISESTSVSAVRIAGPQQVISQI